MKKAIVGFAVCGSFCTHKKVIEQLGHIVEHYETVVPLLSEMSAATDTRFGTARELREKVEELCGRAAICTIKEAEPIGPRKLLDVLVVAPCTGNTLAKIACGVTDSSITMAVKAHLRNNRPVVLAISSNDALSANAENIGKLLVRKNMYFVPFGQDDSAGKPCSLVADMSKIESAVDAALEGRQLQPMLV